MSSKYILGIDQGTTGSRVFIFDNNAKIIGSAYKELKQYFPQTGWVEHDPNEIWASTQQLIQDALLKAKIKSTDIHAIGITNQRETTIVWDKQGNPLYNAIVWQCKRTIDICNILKQKGLETEVRTKTGLVIDSYFSATKLKWILDNIEGASNSNNYFGTIDSYLLYKLTNGKSHKTDYTNASRTMLFNIVTKKWDQELINELGVNSVIFPEVQDSASLFGVTQNVSTLPDGIPIYGMVGDQQGALFGQLCFYQGDIKNTYGTGCFTLMNTQDTLIYSNYGLLTTLACNELGKPSYALEGSVFIGGAVMQFLRDSFHFFKNASETEVLIDSVKNIVDDVVFVPAFSGLGAPYWSQTTKGAILGLTRDTSQAQIIRAALKSIAFQSKELIECMEKDIGKPIQNLKVDGGATNNTYLMNFQAALLNIPLVRPSNIDITVLGATYLAGLGSGFWNSIEDIKKISSDFSIFKPSKFSQEDMQKELSKWKLAIHKILE